MKFPYRKLFQLDRLTGDVELILRPEVVVTIHGPHSSMTVSGVADTGSDTTVLPCSIGRQLGLKLVAAKRGGVGFGGNSFDFYTAEAELEIEADGESICWKTVVNFAEFSSESTETVIFGQAGFLEYFRATFDWDKARLALKANQRLRAN